MVVFTFTKVFGQGSHPGEQEVLRWTETIPHDIRAVTLYGGTETIQYEVRNHEGNRPMNYLTKTIKRFFENFTMNV